MSFPKYLFVFILSVLSFSAYGQFSSVECYTCSQVFGDDCNACFKNGDYEIKSGLKVVSPSDEKFIDAPYITRVSGNEITFTEIAAEKEFITIQLGQTKYSRMIDLIEYVKDCSCNVGDGGGGSGGTNTDNQILVYNSNTNELTISGGNTVQLEDGGSGVSNMIYDGEELTIVTTENDFKVDVKGDIIKTGETVVIQGTTYNSQTPISTILQALASMTFPDTDTDDQNLSLSNNTLSIDDGNSVSLSPYLDNTDDQGLTLSGNTLSIENGNSVNMSPFMDNTDNQTLGLNGNNLSISGGNSIDLSAYMADTDDQMLNISQSGNQYSIGIDDGNIVQFNIADDDANPNNELQNLQLVNSTLSITNGNSVILPADSDNQVLSYDSDSSVLSISGGNSITLPSGGGTVNVTQVGQYYQYNVTEGTFGQIEAFVEASDTTVTVNRFQNVVTVTVPAGVDLDYIAVYGNTSDWPQFEDFNVKIDRLGDEFNTNQFDTKPPVVSFINQYNNGLPFPGTTVGSFWKYSFDSPPSPQMQITRNQSGEQTVTFSNAKSNGTARFITVLSF